MNFRWKWSLVFVVIMLGKNAFGADEIPTPTKTDSPVAVDSLSKKTPVAEGPRAVFSKTGVAEMSQTAPALNSNPSQNEGDKAPLAAKPTQVPDFSLPDVVITGNNQLTIGAKRLDRPEDDVTLGTRDLSDLNRSMNDLPGLDKTLTALSTEDTGSSRSSAMILHLGLGDLGTFGGWGLWGQNFDAFQYLVSGGYSNWGGEPAGTGLDGEEKYRMGFSGEVFPKSPLNFNLAGNYQALNAELPYENSVQETHRGLDLKAGLDENFSNFDNFNFQLEDQDSQLTTWNQGLQATTANELQAKAQLAFNELDPFLKSIRFDAGARTANSTGLPTSAAAGYHFGWLEASTQLSVGDPLSLTLNLEGQAGNGLDLPLRFYPSANLLWQFSRNAQLEVTYKNQRTVNSFYETYMSNDHVTDAAGFAVPSETTDEFGIKWTQKISEQAIFSLAGSDGKILNYHQWTDLESFGTPVYVQEDSSIGMVEIKKAAANFQYDFDRELALSAQYQWQEGVNQTDDRYFTQFPLDQLGVALLATREKWDGRIGLKWISDRQAFADRSGLLPAYWNLSVSGNYHFDRSLGVWFLVDNPLGVSYQTQAGYQAPAFNVQIGIEFIF